MTDIAWRWRWPEVDSELLVSQAVADILDSHRQGLFGVERGGQLFVNPVDPKGLLLALATLPHRADRSGWSWLELDAARCRQEIQACKSPQGAPLDLVRHTVTSDCQSAVVITTRSALSNTSGLLLITTSAKVE